MRIWSCGAGLLSLWLVLTGFCAVAEARTMYTIAGGGPLRPPKVGQPPVPATAVALQGAAKLSPLPGGELLIWSAGRRLVLDQKGMLRATRLPRRSLGFDRAGIEYFLTNRTSPGLALRRPRGPVTWFTDVRPYPWSPLVHPDGGVLVTNYNSPEISRITPDGQGTVFVGTPRGYYGDRGPVFRARLHTPTDLAWGPDGGLLIVDRGNHRVQRMDLDNGNVSTVAGNGKRGFGGDGGPATAAPLNWPTDIAIHGRGGFAIAETHELAPAEVRIRRVTRDGIIHTVAGGGPPRWIGSGLGRGTSMLNGDGKGALQGSLYEPLDLYISPADEYLVADSDLIRLVTSRRTQRLALALRAVVPARRRISYTLSVPARLRLVVRGEGRRLVRTRMAPQGPGTFQLPRALRRGGYHVTLTATGADGSRAVREAGVIMTLRLSRRLAVGAIQAAAAGRPLITPQGLDTRNRSDDQRILRCRRFSARRIDCARATDSSGAECEEIRSARLSRQGHIYLGPYGCGRFRLRPRFRYLQGMEPMYMLGPGPYDQIDVFR